MWKKRDVDWHEARHGWAKQNSQFVSVRPYSAQASKGLDECLVEFKPYYETLLPEKLGLHCREWPAGKANAEGQNLMLVEANSKPHDIVSTQTAQSQRIDQLGVHSQAGWKDCT